MNNLLHTPEGVRDVYDAECARKLEVQKKITGVLHSYGYSQIETPHSSILIYSTRSVGA